MVLVGPLNHDDWIIINLQDNYTVPSEIYDCLVPWYPDPKKTIGFLVLKKCGDVTGGKATVANELSPHKSALFLGLNK